MSMKREAMSVRSAALFKSTLLAAGAMALAHGGAAFAADAIKTNPDKDAYFGNLHIHTGYSFDAYTNGTLTTPKDAYRWAQGEPIAGGGGGGDMKIKVPLDWYAVSDHAEYLGVFKKMEDPASSVSKLPLAARVTSKDRKVAFEAFSEVLTQMSAGHSDPALSDPKVSTSIWKEVVATADAYYKPGKFTTFPAFEWSSNPNEQNLHRVVVFGNSKDVPSVPFSSLDSEHPEELWKWMDGARADGATLIAIAHNANASDGLMFTETGSDGKALDAAYSETRMRNEKLYEISQIKGSSDTHPDLSPNDEFADFEIWDYKLGTSADRPTHRAGSYVRDALIRGLALEKAGQGNPFKYGLIGDSDTHNAAATIEEDNYTGKFAIENVAAHRLNGFPGLPPENQKQLREFGSGGVAAVWAESNTREAIYAALARKETFATSGPRMKVRLFGGYGFAPDAMKTQDWVAAAYKAGVPMGGNLAAAPDGKAPVFLIAAMKEANGANLDRVQMIKGWVSADGKTHEKIFDVALSDGRKADAAGKVPPVGNTVDAAKATYTNDIGATEFSIVWSDPEFDAAQPAMYYVRVLAIPTPRWSTYDAAVLGISPRDDLPVSIQERAWSSPIWYGAAG
tara:strand:- start:5419 stop:7287 length:1869 start_codon:yes stop_codon:yes gene_type:complete